MKTYSTQLLRINGISGNLYFFPNRKTSRIVIYGLGAPLVPDNRNLPDAPYILDFDTDIFVPDYIGNGRSDGRFTPQNCIKTFLTLYKKFSSGTLGINKYQDIERNLKYDEIHLIGRSFGGAYVPLLPRFNPEIKNLCLLYPVTDYTLCGTLPGEESIEIFLDAMKHDGYKYFYRGILSPQWKKHFKNEDGLSPIDNIKFLENAKLFIGHGKKDKNINFIHSVNYYNKIIGQFPNKKNQFKIKLYPEGDHSAKTTQHAVVDYLIWAKVPRAMVQ